MDNEYYKMRKEFYQNFFSKFKNFGHFDGTSFTPSFNGELHLIPLEKIFPNNNFRTKRRFKLEEKNVPDIAKILNFEKELLRENYNMIHQKHHSIKTFEKQKTIILIEEESE